MDHIFLCGEGNLKEKKNNKTQRFRGMSRVSSLHKHNKIQEKKKRKTKKTNSTKYNSSKHQHSHFPHFSHIASHLATSAQLYIELPFNLFCFFPSFGYLGFPV